MAEPIHVRADVTVPPEALEVRAVRASGPGGQNVNKVASKVELRVDLGRVNGLDPLSLERLRRLAGRRVDRTGRLIVTSQRTRDQHRNLEDAREKVRALVHRALIRPRPRRPTRVTAAAKARRLAEKKRRGTHKRRRGAVRPDED